MFTVFQCCPELELQYCNIGTSRLPLRKIPDVFLPCWLKTNAVRAMPYRVPCWFFNSCSLYFVLVSKSAVPSCSVPHSLFNASHVETLPCCSVQCSVRIHLLYKFAWIFSKLTDPVWWLLNKSTPWLAMDLSCYSISSIKEVLFFQHDSVHMHLSVSLYRLNDDDDDFLFWDFSCSYF